MNTLKFEVSENERKIIASAMEYYLVKYVWDDLGERDNASAAEKYFKIREIMKTLELERFFNPDTIARF